jgi:hydrogenase large subunit
MLSILDTITTFTDERMLPDVYDIARYYPEYYNIGGGYGNLLSYGIFDNYKELGTLYVDPLVYTEGKISPFNPANIAETSEYSWCKNISEPDNMYSSVEMNTNGAKAYSWIKAPRYNNKPFEVGPLARQWLSGEYKRGISTMDRTIARVLEIKKVSSVIKTLLQNLIPDTDVQKVYSVPESGKGSGLTDTTRGALGHWISVENSTISTYQVITPSAWNLCSRDDNNRGVAEQALIGTPVNDINDPIEIGRVIRSFDPCISCATHVYTGGKFIKTLEINT